MIEGEAPVIVIVPPFTSQPPFANTMLCAATPAGSTVTVPAVPVKAASTPLTHAESAPPVAAVSQFVSVLFHVPVPPLAFTAGLPPLTVPPSQ